MNPVLSIVMPVYGVEKWLEAAAKSALRQTKTRLELILVDDASPDGCGALCDKLAQFDARVRVIHRAKNGGLSAARNDGLAAARGTYVCFMDSDDWIEENLLGEAVDALERTGAQWAVWGVTEEHFGADGRLKETRVIRPEAAECLTAEAMRRRIVPLEWQTLLGYAWNKLYRRELWDGIRFPEGKICEDGYVMHEVIGRCSRISVVKERLYRYTQREESIIHSGLTVRNLAHVEACCRRLKYFEKNGYRELCPDAARIAWEQYQWLRKEIPTRTWKEKLCLWQTGRMVRRSCRKYGPELPEKDPDRV